ncbi:MAG: YCF48-related protein, partial [Pyrinomonadaceae bacterium]
MALLLLLLSADGFAQSRGWLWQNPRPQGNMLYAVRFAADHLRGWAVGADGVILHTVDGGFSWASQKSPAATALYGVCVLDKNRVVIVGSRGIVLSTDDGGGKWALRPSNTKDHLYAVTFAPSSAFKRGWAVGTYGRILTTNDGGLTWQQQDSTISAHLLSVSFSDEKIGVAVGEHGTLLWTVDGGATWQARKPPAEQSPPGTSDNSQTGIARFSDAAVTVLISTKTENFRESQLPLTGVAALSSVTAVAVGYGGRVLRTADGGNTWRRINVYTRADLFAVHFTDERNGWAAGDDGLVLATGDGGETWLPISIKTGPRLSGLHFTDARTGWAVGADGLMLRTNDGGLDWRRLTEGARDNLSEIFFLDNARGWAVGARGKILLTTS